MIKQTFTAFILKLQRDNLHLIVNKLTKLVVNIYFMNHKDNLEIKNAYKSKPVHTMIQIFTDII